MLSRRVLSVVLVFTVVLSFTALAVPIAHADEYMNFGSVVSSCESGNYTVIVSGQDILFDVRVVVWDANGTKLGEDTFSATSGATYSRSITYSPTAEGPTVTYKLYYSASRLERENFPADTVTVDASCKAIPGCDLLIPLPSTAVVGEFVSDAAAYWKPGQLITNPSITIQAGKTYYVIGQDESQQYYKVLLGCSFVWVLKPTVGPNNDAVWMGKPLPTDIVN
jgi:hypothetical protein